MTSELAPARRRRPVPAPTISIGAANLQLRFLAWLIDIVLITFTVDLVVNEIVKVPVTSWLQRLVSSSPENPYNDIALTYWVPASIMFVSTLVLSALIVVPALRLLRATPGQRLMRLMTVPASGAGRVGAGSALARVFILFAPWAAVHSFQFAIGFDPAFLGDSPSVGLISTLPWVIRGLALAWYGVLAISIATTPSGSALHDRFTGSIVLRRFGSD